MRHELRHSKGHVAEGVPSETRQRPQPGLRKNARMPVQAIPTASKRLRILGDEEIDALYGRPHFTPRRAAGVFLSSAN